MNNICGMWMIRASICDVATHIFLMTWRNVEAKISPVLDLVKILARPHALIYYQSGSKAENILKKKSCKAEQQIQHINSFFATGCAIIQKHRSCT
jgi:predicted nucleic acid-binding protein